MTAPPGGYYGQLAGRALTALLIAYTLTLGGTFHGMLLPALHIVSLVLLTLAVLIWIPRWRGTPLDPVLALWAGAYAVAVIAHPTGRAWIGLWYAGLYAGVWWVLSNLRQAGMPGRWLTDGALLTSIPIIVLALVQVADWFPAWRALEVEVAFVPPRPVSTLGHPNPLGCLLAMLLPLGLVRTRWSVRPLDRALWAIWVMLAGGTLYLTYSRGAWLGAALGVLVLTGARLNPLRWWRQQPAGTRRTIAAGGAVLALAGLILVLITLSAFDTPRRSSGQRLHLYRVAWQSFLDYPLTGTGPFTFGLTLLDHSSTPPEQPHAHAHNLILNVAAELGLPGLFALAATGLLIIRRGGRSVQRRTDPGERAHAAACLAGLMALAVHSMVDMPGMVPAVALLGIALLAVGIDPAGSAARRPPRALTCTAGTGLWAAVLLAGWYSAAVYTVYLAALPGDGGATCDDTLERAAESFPPLALYDAELGYACGLAGDTGTAIAAYRRALEAEPPHALWWANLAALYWQAGQSDDALDAMRRAADYAPGAPDLWLNLGRFYEEQGDSNEAREAYRRALEASSEWSTISFWDETDLRRALLAEHLPPPPYYVQARTLWQAGDRAGALAVLRQRIDRDPSQPGPYVRLARLYLTSGDLESARDQLAAARVLAHTGHDRAWLEVVEAELARAASDEASWADHMAQARRWLWPDSTGYPMVYGENDVAIYQFLRLRPRGALLPSLIAYSPDPELVDLLRR